MLTPTPGLCSAEPQSRIVTGWQKPSWFLPCPWSRIVTARASACSRGLSATAWTGSCCDEQREGGPGRGSALPRLWRSLRPSLCCLPAQSLPFTVRALPSGAGLTAGPAAWPRGRGHVSQGAPWHQDERPCPVALSPPGIYFLRPRSTCYSLNRNRQRGTQVLCTNALMYTPTYSHMHVSLHSGTSTRSTLTRTR